MLLAATNRVDVLDPALLRPVSHPASKLSSSWLHVVLHVGIESIMQKANAACVGLLHQSSGLRLCAASGASAI
jgi:SpoVK/Ycf46/Vps4 family AAA+-type ATPase